ncbi:MAG: hypothetical protein IJ137_07715 [Eubacterium sp.]|nr:hypothetical protein [Eubacterium sp.]
MNKKKAMAAGLAAVIIAALAAGGTMLWQHNRKNNAVKVYPMESMNMADYVDYGSELTGTIFSDYVQEVIPDGSREIEEIYVKKGQKVKKGDKLLKYNVEEQEIDVKLQELQIQSAQLQIENMEKELTKLKNTKPVGSIDAGGTPALKASLNLSGIRDAASMSLLKGAAAGTLMAANEDETDQTGGSSGTDPDDSGSDVKQDENTDESGETEDPLAADKQAAVKSLESYKSEGSDVSDHDKALENAAITKYSESINKAGTSEEIDSQLKAGIAALKEIAKLQEKRDSAVDALKDYVGDKRYGKADNNSSDEIINNTSKALEDADTADQIEELKKKALDQLKELHGGPRYTKIDDAYMQQSVQSGSGDSADDTIFYLLVKDGTKEPTITGDVVQSFFTNSSNSDGSLVGKYIQFRVYDSEDSKTASTVFQLTPDAILKGKIDTSKNYTVEDLKNLVKTDTTPAGTDYLLKSVTQYNQKQSGRGTQKSKYIYNLKKDAYIKGSVINYLISKKKYAIFRDYESEDAYAAGTPSNVISITPDTKFSPEITGVARYRIKDLNKLLVSVKSVKVTPKKKGLKTVKTGNKYKFIAKVSGTNVSGTSVKWTVTNAKSSSTKISSGGVLTVASGEKAGALKITAKAGTKKGSYLVSVKKSGKGSSGSGSSSGDDDSDIDDDDVDDDGGTDIDDENIESYTAEELKDAISDKEDEIAEAKQDLSEAKISLKEAKAEVEKAIVRATISGKVTLAYTASDAPTDSPAIIIRADDGMYVKTAVSELVLDTVTVGGKLLCTSYETNESYDAEVREVADYPTEDSTADMTGGNPNSSFYQVIAYIKDAEGLKIGDTVNISYDSQTMGTASGDTIYLPIAYVRTEGKKSYVYKADKEGRLKKSYVKTGGIAQGQFIEITAGLTLDDKIAFPYGKNLIEGAKTEVAEDADDIVW